MTRERRPRGGLRDLDDHCSWREVYAALDAPTGQHDQEVRDGLP